VLPNDRAPEPEPLRPTIPLPPDSLRYRLKSFFLGDPLHTEALAHERLGNPTALAVFASDNLSSSAYATEEILRVLVPAVGVAAFSLVMPITLAMLGVLALLILSYRQTIKAYPQSGSAYLVTRDNFGIVVAQVAGVALLTDYILTVAVSVAAGTAALTSAFHALTPYRIPIAVSFILIIAFGNLRGLRESGKVFAVPTYFFMINVAILLGMGLWQHFLGDLPRAEHVEGMREFGDAGSGLLYGASIFIVLHAFASGGAAVTGVEAISDGVPAFRAPEWKNARLTLTIMGCCLGIMFLGISLIASKTHVVPFEEGTPTVIAQIGRLVYGAGATGDVLFYMLQAATMLILVMAANTSFADFPRLASFQAGDSFLPRQLTQRGHRLVFSNGIIFLSAAAMGLVVVTGAEVERLIPLYAVGVFTSFTLSQAGMTKRHLRLREPGWQRGVAINGVGAFISAVVAVIVAVTKFTHGAWAIIVAIPIFVLLLLRLARQYETEAYQLEHDVPDAVQAPLLRRHVVFVFIDRLDLAAARAIQYARSLRPDELRAVHFVVDHQKADALAAAWRSHGLSHVALELVDCPDRRLTRVAVDVVAHALDDRQTEVTVLLPDRKYRGFWHRILHDQTADEIALAVSSLPHANVTTVPFHFDSGRRQAVKDTAGGAGDEIEKSEPRSTAERPADVMAISEARLRRRARVAGRVEGMRLLPAAGVPTIELTLADDTARISVVFHGRRELAGVDVGTRMTVVGMVVEHKGRLAVINPAYEIHPPIHA